MIYDRVLTSEEIAATSAALGLEYGITQGAAPTFLWSDKLVQPLLQPLALRMHSFSLELVVQPDQLESSSLISWTGNLTANNDASE